MLAKNALNSVLEEKSRLRSFVGVGFDSFLKVNRWRWSMTSMQFRFAMFLILVGVLRITHIAEAADAKVRVAIPSESMAQIAFYVGIEKGYYKQEGLDVELILMRAPVANLSLIGGDVNFSTVPAAALNAALRGAPLRVIYSTFYRPMHWLYAKPQSQGR
jgi:ABC-type nitrate/sulfonate/bicarbonate transport system substrate-binding protein